jgi:broad specificity phosphatase PhoE
LPAGFDVGFSSPFIRAKETAGLLGNIGSSPEFRWKVNPVIRERDYGRLDKIPYPKELEGHLKYLEGRTIERLFWPPPGGESIQRVQPRADRFFATLHRHYSDKSVMAVAHGDFILAAILEICRMSYEEFEERKKQRDPFLHIENCQIVEFTRVDPVTGEVADHLDWVRSICPWDPNWEASACASWQRIERRTYSPGELLTQARQQPRYF